MNFLLSVDLSSSIYEQNLTDALIFGLQIVAIGLITTFAVLTLIWGCLGIFKLVFQNAGTKAKPEKVIIEETVAPEVTYESSDDEIVAVIAAAIAAAESEACGAKFRVVSFRRK